MKRMVDQRFYELCRVRLDECMWYSDTMLRETWHACRRRGLNMLKGVLLLITDHRPLFDGIDPTPGCIVYAYSGKIAKVAWRVVKLGYTDQNLDKYLRSKRIAHDPILLANTPGDLPLEDSFKAQWRHLLADGKEWFHPDRSILDWIPTVFGTVEPTFRTRATEAYEEYVRLSNEGRPQ